MKYELVVGPEEGADLNALEAESRDELEDELSAILGARPEIVTVSLHPRGRAALSIPEAVSHIVEIFDAHAPGVAVLRLVFGSQRAKDAAEQRLPGRAASPRAARFGALQVSVVQGDITRTLADAIVNASNVRLELGAGVSGAIKRAVKHADALQGAMYAKAPIQPGDVVTTPSFGLPTARAILHAATASGGEAAVARALRGALRVADASGFRSLAIPALGTGTGGLAIERFGEVLRAALDARSQSSEGSLEKLVVVLATRRDADVVADRLSAR